MIKSLDVVRKCICNKVTKLSPPAIKPTLFSAAATIALCGQLLHVPSANAQGVYSFGDSLSDTGNISGLTFGLVPGGDYFSGRFSNGLVWNDVFALALEGRLQNTNAGLGPLFFNFGSRFEGFNFAHGGAVSGGNGLNFSDILGGQFTGLLEGLPPFQLTSQANHFRSSRFFGFDNFRPGSGDYATVWAGGNDYFNGETSTSFVVGNIITSLQTIRSGGIDNFIVVDLPALGDVPGEFGTSRQNSLNALAAQHNARLTQELSSFAARNVGERITLVRASVLFNVITNDALNNGGATFGFTRVRPGGGSSGSCLGDGLVLSACPNSYLFYDDIHPTAAAHDLIGRVAISSVIGTNASLVDSGRRTSLANTQTVSRNRILSARFQSAQAGFTGSAFLTEGTKFSTGTVALDQNGLAFQTSQSKEGQQGHRLTSFRYVDGPAPEYLDNGVGNPFDLQNFTLSSELNDGEYVSAYAADYFITDKMLIGAFFSHSAHNSDAFDIDSFSETEDYALYGAYFHGPWALHMVSGITRMQSRSVRETGLRELPIATGQGATRIASTRIDGAYTKTIGRFSFGAEAKLGYSEISHDGFQETGTLGLVDQLIEDNQLRGTSGYMGIKASAAFAARHTLRGTVDLSVGALGASSEALGYALLLEGTGYLEPGPEGASLIGLTNTRLSDRGLLMRTGLSFAHKAGFDFRTNVSALMTGNGDLLPVAKLNAVYRF